MENAVLLSDVEFWNIFCFIIIPLSSILYTWLLLYLEKKNKIHGKYFYENKDLQSCDESTIQEEKEETYAHMPCVVLKGIRKVYKRRGSLCHQRRREIFAIKNLNMVLNQGEIFALMGSNGAGKSTIMKILSNHEKPTFGKVILPDMDQNSISCCSEDNIIWPELTVEEHLYLFGTLNGLSSCALKHAVKKLIRDLDMKKEATKEAQYLSGGFQRKLCIAISLLGRSKLLLLDEPTTGMDSVSKNHVWKRLHEEFSSTGIRTLVITTHSSYEAEVHCSRIGLFVNGLLRYIGTIQDLQRTYGKGFELKIKLGRSVDKNFKKYLYETFPGIIEKNLWGLIMVYYIPKEAFTSPCSLFQAVGKIQKINGVESCFLNEYSMDQKILDLMDDIPIIKSDDDLPFII